jgi:hypothetical protein
MIGPSSMRAFSLCIVVLRGSWGCLVIQAGGGRQGQHLDGYIAQGEE